MEKETKLLEEFQVELFPLLKKRVNFALLLAVLLVPSFSWVDYFFYPEHFETFLAYRLITGGLVLLLFFFNRRSTDMNTTGNIAILGYYLVGLFLILMIREIYGCGTPYYAGLILLFIVFLTFLPFNLKTHFVHTSLLYLLYLLSCLFAGNGRFTMLFLVNNMFIISSLGVLLVGVYFNYQKRFEEFTARKLLEEAEEKLGEYARKLEHYVEESESKYATVVNNAREGIVVVRDERVVFWNPEAEQIFCRSDGSLEDRNFQGLFPKERRSAIEKACRSAADMNGSCTVETLEISCENHERKWLEVMAVPVKWQSGPAGLFFIRDVTSKRTLERELIQAQKMEAMGTLASGVAHDLNNIFQIIAGYVQMGQEMAVPDSRTKYFFGQIEKTVERASMVTRQLLIFSRKEKTRRETIDVNKQIVSLSRLLQRVIPKMIRVDLRLAADAGAVFADPIQFEQVLMNLALNARDAMPEGGELVISTDHIKNDSEVPSLINSADPGNGTDKFVRIQVRDTGIGMVPEVRERIFDPFFTTKKEGQGTGLGLAIVYGIVKRHAGWIICDSEPDIGTTFSVFFPACRDDERSVDQVVSSTEDAIRSSETILLVDDEEQIRDIGKDMLEKVGFRIIPASSGEEALELFKKEGERVNLVLLDLNMPGMGGFRCLKRLKEMRPDIKVIICTGYLDDETITKIRELDVEDFVHKPFRFSEILPIIRARLSG